MEVSLPQDYTDYTSKFKYYAFQQHPTENQMKVLYGGAWLFNKDL